MKIVITMSCLCVAICYVLVCCAIGVSSSSSPLNWIRVKVRLVGGVLRGKQYRVHLMTDEEEALAIAIGVS